MDAILDDIQYAYRRLLKQPGFTLAAVLTLALGTGVNIALFTILNALLLRPTPGVHAPDRLVAIYTSDFSGPPYGSSSFPDYEAVAQADVFVGVAAFTHQVAGLGDTGDSQAIAVELVTPNFFDVLGVRVRGRSVMAEDVRSTEPVAVISDALWRTRFGGDDNAIGNVLRINGQAVTIAGIAPPGFRGGMRGFASDVWLPIAAGEPLGIGYDLDSRGNRGLSILARLQDGVTPAAAEARLRVMAEQLRAAYPDAWTDINSAGRRLTVLSERDARVPPAGRAPALAMAALLAGMAGLLLLACCANLAGLMLSRVSARGRELAIRLSIGATPSHIRRLLLTESALLACAGTIAGFVAALWMVDAVLSLIPASLPVFIALDVQPDVRVTVFVVAIAAVTGLLFGSAPALHAGRASLSLVMRTHVPELIRGRRLTLRGVLVAGQVAVSVVLLITALLFVRSLRAAIGVDLGYATRDLMLLELEPAPGSRPDDAARTQATLEIVERIAQLPDVNGASWASIAPLGTGTSRRMTTIEGYTPPRGADMEFHIAYVGPDYFRTMGLPLVSGRDFAATDRTGAPPVMIVNETFARRFFPGQNAIGKRVSLTGAAGEFVTIAGVARDARYVNVAGETVPHMFVPALQQPRTSLVHARTRLAPAEFERQVRAIVHEVAPSWEIRNPRTMESQVGIAVIPQRIAGRALTAFGILALLLAAIGLYGVVAFAVERRTREMGIRLALGASQESVIRLTMDSALRIVAIGLGAGLVVAAGITRLIGSLLLGTSPFDAASFVGATSLLLAVTALAMYMPARRIVRIDPLATLREE